MVLFHFCHFNFFQLLLLPQAFVIGNPLHLTIGSVGIMKCNHTTIYGFMNYGGRWSLSVLTIVCTLSINKLKGVRRNS
jgi:hypothetical protein